MSRLSLLESLPTYCTEQRICVLSSIGWLRAPAALFPTDKFAGIEWRMQGVADAGDHDLSVEVVLGLRTPGRGQMNECLSGREHHSYVVLAEQQMSRGQAVRVGTAPRFLCSIQCFLISAVRPGQDQLAPLGQTVFTEASSQP